MQATEKIQWQVAMMVIALLAGSLLADEPRLQENGGKQSAERSGSDSGVSKDRLPAFDRDLNTIGFRIVSVDLDGNAEPDIQQVFSDRNEDNRMERAAIATDGFAGGTTNRSRVGGGQTGSGLQSESDAKSQQQNWLMTDLRKNVASVTGRVVDKRSQKTAFGKHVTLRLVAGSDEVSVDCGRMEVGKSALAVGEKVRVQGLTSVGIVDDGLLAFSVAPAEGQTGASSNADDPLRESVLLEGEVVDVLVGPVGDRSGMRVVVETEDGLRTFVALGAREALKRTPKQGERLKAVGVGGTVDGKTHFVAHKFAIVK